MTKRTVRITMFNGKVYSGIISSYADYGCNGQSDRYIEFVHNEESAGRTGDPGYIKEQYDMQHQAVKSVEVLE